VRVAWEGHSAHSAARLLAIPAGGEKPSAQADAETFLRDALSRGPQTANDVLSGARKARISEKTLRRAKAALGVEAEKEKESMDGPWLWMLPPDPPKMATGAEDGQSGDDGHLQGGWPSSALPVEAVVTREREVAEL